MTTPNAQLIAELEHVAFCDYTLQKDLLDRAIAALSQPAIPKTLGDTVALIVRDVCELEYPAHPDKPMLLTVSVNELSEILMDRLSQDAAIQQEPVIVRLFKSPEGVFFAHVKGQPGYQTGKDYLVAEFPVDMPHPQPATQPQPDKAAELTDNQIATLINTTDGDSIAMCRAIIAADRALRNGAQP